MHYREILCKCRCGGLVVNNIEIYVSEDEKLVVIGNCNMCSTKDRIDFKLDELILKCPRRYAKKNGLEGCEEEP